jgi:4-amino-4-deoxy-L-arabinose transferase-like glycosyltransferase
MLELVVGHNAIQRFVRRAHGPEGALPSAGPVSSAGPAVSQGVPDATATPSAGLPRGRDYAPAGALRLAAPHLAAQMGWLFPLAVIGAVAACWRKSEAPLLNRERPSLALWAGLAVCYGVVFTAAGGLFHAYYLVMLAPALSALAGIGVVRLASHYSAGRAGRLLAAAALVATALWQAHIVNGYLAGYLAIGENWLQPALIGASGLAAAGLIALPSRRGLALALGAFAISLLLAMPAAWSVGTVLVKGNIGFPAASPPFLGDVAEIQRRRWTQVAGALESDPKFIAFLRQNHRGEEYLLVAGNARQAAPIIIATGDRVMALGGFTGRNPILTVDGFARLVERDRVRFALIGDGSPGLRRVFGADGQKALVDWIRENGWLVDATLWRSTVSRTDPEVGGRPARAAEMIGAELYDLRRGR